MRNFLLLGILVLAVTVASNSLFVVKQTERAVMLQFGEIVNADIEPGLHVKMPLVNTVRKFDARILTEDSPRQRYLTLEQKALEVDSYAKWRIVDVGQFYISTRGEIDSWSSACAAHQRWPARPDRRTQSPRSGCWRTRSTYARPDCRSQ